MDAPLLTDGQFTAFLAVVGTGFGAIAAAIRWVGGRFVKSVDELKGSVNEMTKDGRSTREVLVKVESIVQEGRNDIRELRELAARLRVVPEPTARPRVASNPAGVPILVHADADH